MENCSLGFSFSHVVVHFSLNFQAIRIGSVVPTGVSHTASRACKFKGYDIPEGVIVMPYVASAQHDPSVFPEPHQFRPERFLDDAGNLKIPVKYNPFGMGKLISDININNDMF